MSIRVNYGVVCEDIRREDNGKLFLIGVYGKDIRARAMPATLVLSLYANVAADETFSGEIEFRCLVNGEISSGSKGNLVITETGDSAIIFPAVPVVVPTASLLEFQLLMPNQGWITITTIPVRDESPTASPQPS